MNDYTVCACCGAKLDRIEQVLPKRTLVLVTCVSDDCHKDVRWQTKSVPEHRELCASVKAECRTEAGA